MLPAVAERNPEPQIPAAKEPARTMDVDHAEADFVLPLAMQKAAAEYGVSYQQIFTDVLKLSFGPGKLTAEEYFDLRLFDNATLAGADKRAFVGFAVGCRVWHIANHDVSWLGAIGDKVAFAALLGSFGLPIVPTLALYALEGRGRSPGLLRTAGALEAFLRDPAHYPLFGKPTESCQSLGAASFDAFDAPSGSLRSIGGREIPLHTYISDVMEHYGEGYLFQRRLSPHPAVRAICGDRQATVRVITINPSSGPELLSACWKIPSVAHAADNFWRSGNMLAKLNLETGAVERVIRGVGIGQTRHETHPDTGAQLTGFTLPDWKRILDLALEAHAALPSMGLIGWDVATTESGPVVVEANASPDFLLPQIANSRGLLDARFNAFLAERKAGAIVAKREAKREVMGTIRRARQRVLGSIRSDVVKAAVG